MPLRIGCRADDTDKHEFDVTFLLYQKGKLYSAGDDGRIKVWSPDLTKLGEVQAHPCSVYGLAASDTSLYSCSNEGTVKSFDLTSLKEKQVLAQDSQTEFWRLGYSDGALFAGDNNGTITVWKDEKPYGSLNVAEPVKDLVVSGNILFTVKDTDLVITDVHLGGEKLQFGTKNTYPGRAPVALIGKQLLGFTSREGKDIIVNENNDQSHFKPVTKVEVAKNPNKIHGRQEVSFEFNNGQGAHELIINALAGTTWNNKNVLFSGGWDKTVKKWNIDADIIKQDASLDVEIVINAIAIGDSGEIYVGGGDGHIVRIEVE